MARKRRRSPARRKPRALLESRTRAAAMAQATRGRSRVFEAKSRRPADRFRTIREGRDEYEADR